MPDNSKTTYPVRAPKELIASARQAAKNQGSTALSHVVRLFLQRFVDGDISMADLLPESHRPAAVSELDRRDTTSKADPLRVKETK